MNTNKPILQLLDEFIQNQGSLSEISRIKYRDNLHHFIFWLSRNGNVVNPTRRDIIAYRDNLIKSGRAAMTVDCYLSAVKRFFAWLEDEGIYDNIAVGIRSPKKPRTFRKDYLRPEQINKLLSSIDRTTIIGLRDYAIINLMVRTGMRCIEVSRANLGDICLYNGKWVIKIQGKGRHEKDRMLGITEKVVMPIYDYAKAISNDDVNAPLFFNHSIAYHDTRITPLTITKMIKKRLRSIGIDDPKITAHSLRHTAAIIAIKSGVELNKVRLMLGHSSINTTIIYLKALEEELMLEGTVVRIIDTAIDYNEKTSQIKEILSIEPKLSKER